jgi:hypothetical protein
MNKWEGETSKANVVDAWNPIERNIEPLFCHKCRDSCHLVVDYRKGWLMNRCGNVHVNTQTNKKLELSGLVALFVLSRWKVRDSFAFQTCHLKLMGERGLTLL